MLDTLTRITEKIVEAIKSLPQMPSDRMQQKIIISEGPLSLWWSNLFYNRPHLILRYRYLPVDIFLLPWAEEEKGFKLLHGIQLYRAKQIKEGNKISDFTLYIDSKISLRNLFMILSIFLLQAGLEDESIYEFLKKYFKGRIDPERINEFLNVIRIRFHPWHYKEILKYLNKTAKDFKEQYKLDVHRSTIWRWKKQGKIKDNSEVLSVIKQKKMRQALINWIANSKRIALDSARRRVKRLENKGFKIEDIIRSETNLENVKSI